MSFGTCAAAASASCLLALYFWPDISERSLSRSNSSPPITRGVASNNRSPTEATPVLDAVEGELEVDARGGVPPLSKTAESTDSAQGRRKLKAVKFELERNVWVSPERFDHDDEGQPAQQR